MKTGFTICFTENEVGGEFLMEMFTQFVKFTPKYFHKKYSTKEWDERKHLKIISKSKPGENIAVYDLNYNYFGIGSTGSKIPFTSFNIDQDVERFLPSNNDVEPITLQQGFISAYLYDQHYVELQSTECINNLDDKGFGQHLYDTLKDTPYKIGLHNHKNYDIRYNPGRMDLISYTWLLASWKMWFGKPFFELVPKEKMLGFKGAYDIKELINGNIYVQLFEKIDESHTYENMRLQQKWRDEMGYHDLISKYS